MQCSCSAAIYVNFPYHLCSLRPLLNYRYLHKVALAVLRGGQELLPLKVAPIQPSVTAAFHLQSRRDSDCQMWELGLNVDYRHLWLGMHQIIRGHHHLHYIHLAQINPCLDWQMLSEFHPLHNFTNFQNYQNTGYRITCWIFTFMTGIATACQTWMWSKRTSCYFFSKIGREIDEQSFGNPTP